MTARVLFGALVFIAALPVISRAGEDSAAAPSGVATAATLERLNAQAAILEVQARIAKARRDIAEAEKGSSGTEQAGPISAETTPGGSDALVLPNIRSIYGSGRDLTAELGLPGGGTIVVTPGSTIRGLGRVLGISERGVIVQAGGERVTLPFGSDTGAEVGLAANGRSAAPGLRPGGQPPAYPFPLPTLPPPAVSPRPMPLGPVGSR